MSDQASNALAKGHQKLLGHLASLAFAALIAFSFSIGDLAVAHIDPVALTSFRLLLAVVVMTAIYLALHGKLPTVPKAPWRFAILGFCMAFYFVMMFKALEIAQPVSTGAVFTLVPLMSAGFGWLILRQTTQPIVLLSLVIAAAGAVWVIFRADIDAILGFRIGKGEAIFFFGCVAHAVYAPLIRKLSRGEPVIVTAFMTLIATAIWVPLFGFPSIFASDWTSLPLVVWLAAAYLAVFTTAGTFFLLQFASLRLPASKVLSYGYLIPCFIIFYEGILGHGWVSFAVMAGALVTALALVVMVIGPDQ
ncbi:DMT family transporter [Alphaproteobacteria bacterium]|nr:DMT family transporter [Alphaproteobacteria bacterium]